MPVGVYGLKRKLDEQAAMYPVIYSQVVQPLCKECIEKLVNEAYNF